MYLFLFVLWLVFNGRITWEILLFGLAITAALGFLCRLLFGYGPRKELRLYRNVGLFLVYLAVLLWEILKANLAMLSRILQPGERVDPAVIRVRVDLKTEFARYMLANSITLTPGTLTVESEGDVLTVHCLHPALLEDTEKGVLVRLLRRMEA